MLDLAYMSSPGPRPANEDAILIDRREYGSAVLAVADGLGGHFGGSRASQIAVDAISRQFTSQDPAVALAAAHELIRSAQGAEANLRDMATTATAVYIQGTNLVGAHCGDTRCVIQRNTGIQKLTVEHTEAQRLFRAGKLSKEEFAVYPRRNILDRALGAAELPEIDIFEFELRHSDKIILTSDGIHERIKLRELLNIIQDLSKADDVIEAISSEMDLRGAEDNYSVIVAIVS